MQALQRAQQHREVPVAGPDASEDGGRLHDLRVDHVPGVQHQPTHEERHREHRKEPVTDATREPLVLLDLGHVVEELAHLQEHVRAVVRQQDGGADAGVVGEVRQHNQQDRDKVVQDHLDGVRAGDLCPAELVEVAAQFQHVVQLDQPRHRVVWPVLPMLLGVKNPDGCLRHEERVESEHAEGGVEDGSPRRLRELDQLLVGRVVLH